MTVFYDGLKMTINQPRQSVDGKSFVGDVLNYQLIKSLTFLFFYHKPAGRVICFNQNYSQKNP